MLKKPYWRPTRRSILPYVVSRCNANAVTVPVREPSNKGNPMKHELSKPILVAAALCVAGAAWAADEPAGPAAAEQVTKPMALRGIMDQMGRDMQEVAGAIAREDWPAVAVLAPRIADHEEPPATEKVRILAWLGTDALKFRGADKRMGEAAATLSQAASAGDGAAVIDAFANVQRDCLACHQAYRQDFVQRFYGGD